MRLSTNLVMIIAGCVIYTMWPATDQGVQPLGNPEGKSVALADVTLPETFSKNARIGKQAFDNACADCHGTNADEKDGTAPPLVHIVYEPSYHGDQSFLQAVAGGVRAHHWPFGEMPGVEGVTRGNETMIVAYIREFQRANGIN